MKLSVIVPIFNTLPYLEETLNSIHQQSFEDMEVLCIDDNSTDGSENTIDKYCKLDKRFAHIRNSKNLGLHMSRKIGVENAKGDYTWFVDGDDTINNEVCTKLIQMIGDKQVDILHFGSVVLNKGNLPPERVEKMRTFVKPYNGYLKGNDILTKCFKTDEYKYSAWNKIYKTEILKKSFSIMINGNFKAQDKYEYFIVASNANTYYGTEEIIGYNYNFGTGITGHNYLSRSQFSYYCSMSKSAYGLKCYYDNKKWSEDRTELYNKFYKELLEDCVANWFRLDDNYRSDAFDEMVDNWGAPDVVSAIAKKNWFNQGNIAKMVCNSKKILSKKREIKTIATYYHKYCNGGVQRVLSGLFNIWIRMGYNVIFLTDLPPSPDDYYLPPSVKRFVIPSYYETNKDNYAKRAHEIESILVNNNVDVFVTHAWISDTLLWDTLICKLNNIAVISYCHNVFALLERNLRGAFASLANIYNLMDCVLTLSDVDKRYWSNFNNNVIELLNPLTFDPLKYEPAKLDNNNILWLGRLSEEKNPVAAIKIFKKVHDIIPESTLTVVGEGDKEITKKVMKLTIEYGLEGSVIFKGFKSEVIPEYYDSSIFLCTSEYEGFLLTLAESLSLGIPCVLFELPYLKITREGKGFIQVPQNNIDLASENIIRLLSNKEYRNQLGTEGKTYMHSLAEYDYDQKWSEILSSVNCEQNRKIMTDCESMMWETLFSFYRDGVHRINASLERYKKQLNQIESFENPRIMQMIGRAYRDGTTIEKNVIESEKWMALAYSKTKEWVNEYIALLWEINTDQSIEKMVTICSNEKNNAIALRALARLNMKNNDVEKAKEYYEKSLMINPDVVLYEYANILYNSDNNDDINDCYNICQHYAKYNNKDALYRLGVMYYDGKGVKKNYKKSKELLEKSATAGSKLALNYLKSHSFGTIEKIRKKLSTK